MVFSFTFPPSFFKSYFIELSNKILGMLIGHKWVLGSCLWVTLFCLMCWCSQMFNWDSTNHNLPWYVNHVNGCAWVPSGSFLYSNHFDSLTTVIKTALTQILSSCNHCHDSITVVTHDMPRCLHTIMPFMPSLPLCLCILTSDTSVCKSCHICDGIQVWKPESPEEGNT